MIRIGIKVDDQGTPFLRKVQAAMTGDRKDFYRYVSTQIAEASREHVRALVPSRHTTARLLGAQSTRHLSRAAGAIEGQFSSTQGTLVFPRVSGLSRAFRDFRLKPVKPGIKFLTIAASARTYGKRAREFQDLKFGYVSAPINGRTAMRAALLFPDGSTAYFLVKRAFIPQDRTLLPSDVEFATAAEIGAREYLRAITLA